MFAPIRALAAARPDASPGVLVSAGAVSVVFAATPFLIPTLSSELGITLGRAGLVSTAQVAGFALASFGAGRLLVATRRLLVVSMVVVALANLASAAASTFGLLLVTRFLAGTAMGVVTWVAWADAVRHSRGLGDIAAVGPVAATVASPGLGLLAAGIGYRGVYTVLAGVSALALLPRADVEPRAPVGRSVSRSRSNRLLLVALSLLTLSSSGLFVFAASAGARAELSPLAVSLALSLNALTGIVATRFRAGERRAWAWMAGTAVAALVAGGMTWGPAFVLALGFWGFGFWMAVPAVFRLLADRSNRADERVGDAQSMMALGRVFGPAVGGLVLGADRFTLLALAATGGILASAALVGAVERRRVLAG